MFLIECGNSLCFLQMFKRSVLISLCNQTLDGWFYTIYMDFTHSVWSYTKRCKKSRVLGVIYFKHTGCLCKWNGKYEVWVQYESSYFIINQIIVTIFNNHLSRPAVLACQAIRTTRAVVASVSSAKEIWVIDRTLVWCRNDRKPNFLFLNVKKSVKFNY